MSIPDGLQEHVLWTMDGRVWIENINAINVNGKLFQLALERGWAQRIPQDKLHTFVASL